MKRVNLLLRRIWAFFGKALLNDTAERARARVLAHITGLYGNEVQYGPFKGMLLGEKIWWSKFDVTTKLLGVYEQHIVHFLSEFYLDSTVPFIDIGAADGYYAVGVARRSWAKRVYAFEISEQGRSVLAVNARINNCLADIQINSEAKEEYLAEIISQYHSAFLLIDIEGAEYALLNSSTLELLKDCTMIIELHPRKIENGWSKQQRLMEDATRWFDTEILVRETYTPNLFKELDDFTDEERLMAFSEGRKANGIWLLLQPKA